MTTEHRSGIDELTKVWRQPVAAAQGRWLRSTVRMAPPAAGPTSGAVPGAADPPLDIAIVGESTAAGCGVESHEQGFAGWFARDIAARAGRPVRWQVVGRFGATARRIRHRLVPQLTGRFDLAVLLAGGNDVLSGRTPEEWSDDLSAIVDELSTRADRVVVTGTPPFDLFPSVPTTLGRVLRERGLALDAASEQVCAQRPTTTWVTMSGTPTPGFFASDRFHLSSAGYRHWAEVVADHVVSGEHSPLARS